MQDMIIQNPVLLSERTAEDAQNNRRPFRNDGLVEEVQQTDLLLSRRNAIVHTSSGSFLK